MWVEQYDLNDVGLPIDKDCEVTALIDWELSSPLPFRDGFGCIHTLAGEHTGGEFLMPDEFGVAERGFCTELFGGMPEHIRTTRERRIDLIQAVVILVPLLDCSYMRMGISASARLP